MEKYEGTLTPALYPWCIPLSCVFTEVDQSGTRDVTGFWGPPSPFPVVAIQWVHLPHMAEGLCLFNSGYLNWVRKSLSHTHTHTYLSVVHLRCADFHSCLKPICDVCILQPYFMLQDGSNILLIIKLLCWCLRFWEHYCAVNYWYAGRFYSQHHFLKGDLSDFYKLSGFVQLPRLCQNILGWETWDVLRSWERRKWGVWTRIQTWIFTADSFPLPLWKAVKRQPILSPIVFISAKAKKCSAPSRVPPPPCTENSSLRKNYVKCKFTDISLCTWSKSGLRSLHS